MIGPTLSPFLPLKGASERAPPARESLELWDPVMTSKWAFCPLGQDLVLETLERGKIPEFLGGDLGKWVLE